LNCNFELQLSDRKVNGRLACQRHCDEFFVASAASAKPAAVSADPKAIARMASIGRSLNAAG
jgi:hypothetical protein